ncbi:hypothetical protein ACRBEV_27975 [Methylobacterium phyllosphaerae]
MAGQALPIQESVPTASATADRVAVFLLGAALNFNVLTSTFGLPFQRLSDLLPFLLIPWLRLRRAVVAEALRNAAPSPGSLRSSRPPWS